MDERLRSGTQYFSIEITRVSLPVPEIRDQPHYICAKSIPTLFLRRILDYPCPRPTEQPTYGVGEYSGPLVRW